jgi:hypothetical protein
MTKPRKPRSDAKMYQLPKDVLEAVNGLLLNDNMSYADIIVWLAEKGYKVSQSSLSRYAFKVFESAQRVADDLEKARHIIDVIGKNPELDTTRATTAILKSGLLQKISSAEEEFNDIPIEQAGKLFIQLSKAEAAHRRNDFTMRSKIDLAFQGLEQGIMESIKSDSALAGRLKELLHEAQAKMESADD